jgi:sulfur-carrier protein
MILKLKTFGISRDILGGREVELVLNGNSVGDLRNQLYSQYPDLQKLNSLFIAINLEYAADDRIDSSCEWGLGLTFSANKPQSSQSLAKAINLTLPDLNMVDNFS